MRAGHQKRRPPTTPPNPFATIALRTRPPDDKKWRTLNPATIGNGRELTRAIAAAPIATTRLEHPGFGTTAARDRASCRYSTSIAGETYKNFRRGGAYFYCKSNTDRDGPRDDSDTNRKSPFTTRAGQCKN